MITISKTLTTINERLRGPVLTLGAAASAVAIVLSLVASNTARGQGQVSPLQILPLAQGFTPTKTGNMHVNGPTDVLQALLVFQPGAETGWHVHPGPVVVVVKSGAITETHDNGCITVHPAGSVFFEMAGEVHNAANQTGVVSEVYATFLSPAGSDPLIPASDPGKSCRVKDDR